jgi:hypothetical protein
MPSVEEPADGSTLALEEARRALDAQERTVAQLTTRAGLLISTAAIVTSFLGGPALARGALDPPAWIAVAAFVGLSVAVLKILWPRRDWEFAMHSAFLLANRPLADFVRELTVYLSASITRNDAELDRMMTTLNIGSVCLAIQILAWVVSIATGR